MAENVNQNEVKSESMKDRFSSFLSTAAAAGKSLARQVQETVEDTAKQGKEFVEEKKRDYDADKIYQKLGKKVYKLVSRGEMQLPECCEKYIEALNELYAENPDAAAADCKSVEMDACESSDACAADAEEKKD